MKKIFLSMIFSISSAANAIVISESVFRKNGGNVDAVPASIGAANKTLQSNSYARPWLAVGWTSGTCAATWLGDMDEWRYFLTAAHCVAYQGVETPVGFGRGVVGWNLNVLGSPLHGGTVYVPPERINVPAGLSDASTDIAILKLRPGSTPVDRAGVPLERPILDDLAEEKGKPVIFVGYGIWGVGSNPNAQVRSPTGDQRLYGRSKVDIFFDRGHAIRAPYNPVGVSEYWARTAGDDGSPWWQFQGIRPVIVATTNNRRYSLYSTGTRVSKYANWIKSIYPEARFASEVRAQGCIVSQKNGAKYCIESGKPYEVNLPDWIRGHDIYVQADSGVTVVLSDSDDASSTRLADFSGTVENEKLKYVKAYNGKYMNVSRPESMRLVPGSRPLGCIVSLQSGEKYCLKAGDRSGNSLPDWIKGHEVFVHADEGTAVMLSDRENLSHNRVAVFSGVVQHENLKRVKAHSGQELDFSRPVSMSVVQQ